MRILEGRRRQVEERREGLREAIARASSSLDRYTRQLHQLGLESSEREVKWLNDLIAAERGRPGSRADPQLVRTNRFPSGWIEKENVAMTENTSNESGSRLSASATAHPRWCRVCSTTTTPTRTTPFPA